MKINKYHILAIIMIVMIIFICRYAYKKFYKNSHLIVDQPYYGKDEENEGKNIKTTICNKGISWSYNFWIYINDWKYRFGEQKYIIQSENVNVWLGKRKPDLHIGTNLFNSEKDKEIVFTDLPLQKWLQVTIVLDNRNLDLFINNELYRSIFFDEVPEQQKVTNFIIFPDDGISGYISQVRYYSYNISRSRINIEYSFGFRGIFYKYFFLRMIYKMYMYVYTMIYGDPSKKKIKDIACS